MSFYIIVQSLFSSLVCLSICQSIYGIVGFCARLLCFLKYESFIFSFFYGFLLLFIVYIICFLLVLLDSNFFMSSLFIYCYIVQGGTVLRNETFSCQKPQEQLSNLGILKPFENDLFFVRDIRMIHTNGSIFQPAVVDNET